MRGGLPLESLFEIEVPFPEKENNSELKSSSFATEQATTSLCC